jgi:hypothetical protein
MAGVSFEKFKNDPIKAVLYMALLAIGTLFGILRFQWSEEKKDLKEMLLKCDTKNYTQDVEIKQIRSQYVETFGLLKEVQSKIKTLQELGKIQ